VHMSSWTIRPLTRDNELLSGRRDGIVPRKCLDVGKTETYLASHACTAPCIQRRPPANAVGGPRTTLQRGRRCSVSQQGLRGNPELPRRHPDAGDAAWRTARRGSFGVGAGVLIAVGIVLAVHAMAR
jgi:hypothetical protein